MKQTQWLIDYARQGGDLSLSDESGVTFLEMILTKLGQTLPTPIYEFVSHPPIDWNLDKNQKSYAEIEKTLLG